MTAPVWLGFSVLGALIGFGAWLAWEMHHAPLIDDAPASKPPMTALPPAGPPRDLAGHIDRNADRWLQWLTVYSCPDCGAVLEDEAFSKWCPSCQRSVSDPELAAGEEGPDD